MGGSTVGAHVCSDGGIRSATVSAEGRATWLSEGFRACYPDAVPGTLIDDLIGADWGRSPGRGGVWTFESAVPCAGGGPAPVVIVRERLGGDVDGFHLELISDDAGQLADALADRSRLERLLSISTRLVAAASGAEIGLIVCDEVAPVVGAFGGTMATVDSSTGVVTVSAAVGYAAEVVGRWSSFHVDAAIPLAAAIRGNEAVWLPTLEVRNERFPVLFGVDTGSQALCAVPLRLDGPALGALGLSFAGENPFDRDQRNFLLAVAAQCALALERLVEFRSVPTRRGDLAVVTLEGPNAVSARHARRLAHALASQVAGIDASDVALAASEMVTNALAHAGGPLRVRITVAPQAVRIEVDDTSSMEPHLLAVPGAQGGWGLRILQATSVTGVTARSWGKTVWASFAAPSD